MEKTQLSNQQREQKTKSITIFGAVVNLVLAIIKTIVGFIGNSSALIADGIHSFSDLISDFVVYWTANHSSHAPDDDHPYGHERFETVATLGLGLILFVVGGYIVISAIMQFDDKKTLDYDYLLIIVAILSVISKEFLYQITLKVSREIDSKMLKANAWHHRLDAISSIVVLIGVVGSLAGYPYLDIIAAIIVGFMVIKIAWDLMEDSIKELVDTSIDSKKVAKLKHKLGKIGGVSSVHSLRTRTNGVKIIADVHIQVDGYLSVSEGHMISVSCEQVAKEYLQNLSEVMVHIDPEDDENGDYDYSKIPNRATALGMLNKALFGRDFDKNILDIRLHYLDGKIHTDFYMPLDCLKENSKENILKNLQQVVEKLEFFDKTRVYFS
jgi:cation diffusion facilitator family transporter